MRAPLTLRVALGGLIVLVAAAPSAAREPPTVAVVKPGAGYLVTDPQAKVPIEILLSDEKGPVRAKSIELRPALGRISDVKIVAPGRVLFYYSPPAKAPAGKETLDLEIVYADGDSDLLPLSIEMAAPKGPALSLDLSPAKLLAEAVGPVEVRARARDAEALLVTTSNGRLEVSEPAKSDGAIAQSGSLTPPDELPDDAPSHILVLAASSGPSGYSAKAAGLSVMANLRVSAEIEPGFALTLQGSETNPTPVPAASDGRTVIQGLVRYGSPIHAYAVRAGKKREVPITLATGVVPVAVAAPIPGQNIADGGVGPAIVVAVPPSPFGGDPIWPEITVEGAQLLAQPKLARDMNALVIERPRRPGTVSVLADGAPIASIPFQAAHGELIELEATPATKDERGALSVEVKDLFGSPTDTPKPTLKLAEGESLRVERIGPGRYRAAIPAGVEGETGEKRQVIAQLAPPKGLSADALELAQATADVPLEGPPPALRAEGEAGASAGFGDDAGSFRLGLLAEATAGTTFGGQLVLGGGALAELRPPWLERRLALRAGFEVFRASGAATVDNAGTELAGDSLVAGLVIPIDVGMVILQSSSFEWVGRAGLELRNESAVLNVGSDRAGGGSRFGLSGRVSTGAAFVLGAGSLTAELTLAGIGASAAGFSAADTITFEGALLHVRLDLGFRFWL
ncbi:MAG: hypothetical protein IT384_07525 [Deltaproteobacteria bacterium]|nr:hypothetical protein [Deltaproteobacteria bacterium]